MHIALRLASLGLSLSWSWLPGEDTPHPPGIAQLKLELHDLIQQLSQQRNAVIDGAVVGRQRKALVSAQETAQKARRDDPEIRKAESDGAAAEKTLATAAAALADQDQSFAALPGLLARLDQLRPRENLVKDVLQIHRTHPGSPAVIRLQTDPQVSKATQDLEQAELAASADPAVRTAQDALAQAEARIWLAQQTLAQDPAMVEAESRVRQTYAAYQEARNVLQPAEQEDQRQRKARDETLRQAQEQAQAGIPEAKELVERLAELTSRMNSHQTWKTQHDAWNEDLLTVARQGLPPAPALIAAQTALQDLLQTTEEGRRGAEWKVQLQHLETDLSQKEASCRQAKELLTRADAALADLRQRLAQAPSFAQQEALRTDLEQARQTAETAQQEWNKALASQPAWTALRSQVDLAEAVAHHLLRANASGLATQQALEQARKQQLAAAKAALAALPGYQAYKGETDRRAKEHETLSFQAALLRIRLEAPYSSIRCQTEHDAAVVAARKAIAEAAPPPIRNLPEARAYDQAMQVRFRIEAGLPAQASVKALLDLRRTVQNQLATARAQVEQQAGIPALRTALTQARDAVLARDPTIAGLIAELATLTKEIVPLQKQVEALNQQRQARIHQITEGDHPTVVAARTALQQAKETLVQAQNPARFQAVDQQVASAKENLRTAQEQAVLQDPACQKLQARIDALNGQIKSQVETGQKQPHQ